MKMKRRIPILLLTFLLTFLFGSLTVSAADEPALSLDATTVKLNIGESIDISALGGGIAPDGKTPVWTSYNVNIATVDSVYGRPTMKDSVNANTVTVKAIRKGKTTVSVRVGTARKTCTITVVDPSIKVNKKTATLYVKGAEESGTETTANTMKLTATVKGTTNKQVSWKSSNTKVATVDGEGNVTAHAAGTVVISATTVQGAPKTASCTVTVKQNSLSLNMDEVQLSTQGSGKTIKLAATVVGSSKKVVWSSEDPNVKVDKNGKITVKSMPLKNPFMITATANGITKACEVKVTNGIAITTKQATLYTGAVNKTKRVGNTITLKTNVAKAQRANLTWDIIPNNEVVVKNDKSDGTTVITALKPGTVTIKATLAGTDGEPTTDTCVITVKEASTTIHDTDIQLKTKGISKTYTLNYEVVGPKASVTWKTSNKNIATVSKGKITAKKEGEVDITATANGIPSTVHVTVGPFDPSIKVNQEAYTLYTNKGNTVTLKATVDAPAADKKVEWISSDENVATVSTKGKVTAKGEGQTYITVRSKTKPSLLHAECLITVINSEARMDADGFQEKDAVHENSLYIKKGDTADLMVDVVGSSQSVTYKVMNCFDAVANKSVKSGIITVSKKGLITAKKVGTADVKVTANGVSSICHVTVHDQEEVCKHDKAEDQFIVIAPASCKESGRKERKCSDCEYVETVEIPKEPHKYEGEGTVVVEPTCIKKGLIEIECVHYNVCGSKKIEQIEETDHVWTAKNGDAANIAPTCTERGFRTEYCTTCNATRQVTLPALGHSFGKWMVTEDAEKGKEGSKERVCVRCGETQTGVIPAKPDYAVADSDTDTPESADLVWHDEFNGATLSTDDWNYELHEPGWVNRELQAYVQSDDNIYVNDGKLHIKAIKSGDGDNVSYTSGRINTQGRHDFTYGRFEAKVKVPSGTGFLPAFWMMPTDESYYGQWPKCGEIDIMEVLGSKTDTTYGTLHFGEPHTESQGSYTLETSDTVKDFAEDFHVYACEWEPGEIRFYVDGILFHTENNWFTKREGFGEVAYPAPFDQSFYMILNLAVGGSWPGDPDEDTFADGNDTELVVDYVRVYRKDDSVYDAMEVEKPDVEEVVLRDPDETGNYIVNGNFDEVEDLTTSDNWQLLTAMSGEATAEISEEEKQLNIYSTAAGTVNHSVQIVQADIPMEQGCQYKLTFDAWADEERTIITDITAQFGSWERYLKDKTLELKTEKTPYEYIFAVTADSDANARLEFNLGNQGSIATVHIDNVRLEKTGETVEIPEDTKSVLPDGNYVYNGQFDEGNEPGKERLDYWDLDVKVEGTDVSVTKDAARKLRVSVPKDEDVTLDQIVVKQSPVAITGGKTYALTFDAHADEGETKTVKAQIAGRTFTAQLTDKVQTYKYKFDTAESLKGSELRFLLGTTGITYIDNVRVQEDGLIINGDFSAGLVGYEPFIDPSASASYMVDSLNEDYAFCMDINDTGDADWKIQLKQNDIELKNGTWYRLSFDAKSTMNRKIMYALQRDGLSHKTPAGAEDWTPYFETEKIDLTSEYKNFSVEFKMTYDTDPETILSISMGAVNGIRITEKHTVTIDNIKLEIIDEPEQKPDEPSEPDENLIKNGDFSELDGEGKAMYWADGTYNIAGPVTVSFANEQATYTIQTIETVLGATSSGITLQQENLTLEQGASYQVKFRIKTSTPRKVRYAFLNHPNKDTYDWYNGDVVNLEASDEWIDVEESINVTGSTSKTVMFQIVMGKTDDGQPVDVGPHTIEIDDVYVIKTKSGEQEPETPVIGKEMITNGDFTQDKTGWDDGGAFVEGSEGTFTVTDEKAVFDITNVGKLDYSVQLKQTGLTLVKDQWYQIEFDATSDVDRKITYLLQENGGNWADYYKPSVIDLTNGQELHYVNTFKVDTTSANKGALLCIKMGKIDGNGELGTHKITIDNVSLKAIAAPGTDPDDPDEPDNPDGNLIKNGDFSAGQGVWITVGTEDPETASASFDNEEAAYTIKDVKENSWDIQLQQKGITLEQGKWYEIKFEAKSTVARKIMTAVQRDGTIKDSWDSYYNFTTENDLTNDYQTYSWKLQMTEATDEAAIFNISMGNIEGNTDSIGEHTITIDNVSLREIDAPTIEPVEPNTELIKNGKFEEGETNWEGYIDAAAKSDNQETTVSFANNKATFNINNLGSEDWNVQLNQENLTIEPGKKYKVTLKVKSSVTRKIKIAFMNGSTWYGGKDEVVLDAKTDDELQTVEETITMQTGDAYKISNQVKFQISMGKINDEEITTPHTIEISEVSVIKLADDATSSLTASKPVTITDQDAADEPEEAIEEDADSDEEVISEDEEDSKDEENSEEDADSEEEADPDSEMDVVEEAGTIPEPTTEIIEE